MQDRSSQSQSPVCNATLTSRLGTAESAASTSTNASGETGEIRREFKELYESLELQSMYHTQDFDTAKGEGQSGRNMKSVNVYLDDEQVVPKTNLVDWEIDGDLKNPKNWPRRKKVLNITIIFFMALVSPFASSAIAPVAINISSELKEPNDYLAAFIISSYVLGYAVGPLLVSPLSEIYGRRVLYNVCNATFVFANCMCAISQSTHFLIAMRFLAGCGGSSAFALGPASVADMFTNARRGTVMALLGFAYCLGPAMAPLVGNRINLALQSWRYIFWVIAAMGGLCLLLTLFFLSESYEPVLLSKKARKMRRMTRNNDLRSKFDTGQSPYRILSTGMLRPLRMLFTSPNIFLVSLITAVGYGYLYILYTELPVNFFLRYGWTQDQLGVCYLGVAAGNLVGMIVGGGASDLIVRRRAAKGDSQPENRLLPMIFFWPLTGAGLLVYGWTSFHTSYWAWPMLGTFLFGVGSMTATLFCGLYILDACTVHAASANAASMFLRSTLGGILPIFSNELYKKLDIGWASTILGMGALVIAPVPLLFYRYGGKLRQRFDIAK